MRNIRCRLQDNYERERTMYGYNIGQNVPFTFTVRGRTYCVQLHYGAERTLYSQGMGQNVPGTVRVWGQNVPCTVTVLEGTVYSTIMGRNVLLWICANVNYTYHHV